MAQTKRQMKAYAALRKAALEVIAADKAARKPRQAKAKAKAKAKALVTTEPEPAV